MPKLNKNKIIDNLSVDCVIFGFIDNKLQVLLIERKLEDKALNVNDFVLPGLHVLYHEALDQTATRILKDLTGLEDLYKKQFKTYGNPNRLMAPKDFAWAKNKKFNPRTITVAYYFLLTSDQLLLRDHKNNAQWFPIDELPDIGFDHNQIITEAYEHLTQRIMNHATIFELLPDKFTINDLQSRYESILKITLDSRNFRKKIINKKYIIPLDEKQTGVSKKPARLYMFSRDIYQKIHNKNTLIQI